MAAHPLNLRARLVHSSHVKVSGMVFSRIASEIFTDLCTFSAETISARNTVPRSDLQDKCFQCRIMFRFVPSCSPISLSYSAGRLHEPRSEGTASSVCRVPPAFNSGLYGAGYSHQAFLAVLDATRKLLSVVHFMEQPFFAVPFRRACHPRHAF